jgi:hypothetical protein
MDELLRAAYARVGITTLAACVVAVEISILLADLIRGVNASLDIILESTEILGRGLMPPSLFLRLETGQADHG